MKITFLHISDLHYRPDWPEEIQLVCDKFLDDVGGQLSKYENSFLVFSGDVVSAGDSAAIYTSFESGFLAKLEKFGFNRERRICVPGNHDISQTTLKPFLTMQKGTLAEIKDERTFNDNLVQIANTVFTPKFQHYMNHESSFAEYRCCSASIGGSGWELPGGVGVYCLNSALCSFAGLKDSNGQPLLDQNKLMIDTRSLYRWMSETPSNIRILVMHHPIEWLVEWAKIEIENAICDKFHLVISGHAHRGMTTFASRGAGGSVFCSAPALFSRKSDLLGYSFITIDSDTGAVEVSYRQWTPTYKFVVGVSFTDNDTGIKSFQVNEEATPFTLATVSPTTRDTLAILQEEFDEAITCYSSKKQIWVDRDLANLPETVDDPDEASLCTPSDIVTNVGSYLIRAPKEFGLTSLGRYLSLDHYKKGTGSVLAMFDSSAMPPHRQGVTKCIEQRRIELCIEKESLAGFILDNWQNDKNCLKLLKEIREQHPGLPVIILSGLDDCADIATSVGIDTSQYKLLYLWSLSRARIRELVVSYTIDMASLDEDAVTGKIVSDIDALNIHRTPLNCLLILKLVEQAFEDSPVNRTEMIGRVLNLLFYQFDKIPRYATRPDIKDCEYALGYVCEWMIRYSRITFSKNEFLDKIQDYCKSQLIELDSEILFVFLMSENILIRKGLYFGFRFSYWLFFFAAHRMHHSNEFAKFILSDYRYSAYPEIIEFYTGIDRRRSDAIAQLTLDLKTMNSEFLLRTGISESFNPFQQALWNPNSESIVRMQQEVSEGVSESTLPAEVKDAIADESYDRGKPYRQEVAEFIQQSSLIQMVQAMRGAARALRNSDHVDPKLKKELLQEVMNCWIRVAQILVLVSPILALHRTATFEGIGFLLDKRFDQKTDKERWQQIMTVVPDNVIMWFQEDIFSKKLGLLLSDYAVRQKGTLGELFTMLIMAKQRPPGWDREIERFIVTEDKNSYYLSRVYSAIFTQYKTSFTTERTRQQLRRLAAMSVAKHNTGAKHPNTKLVERAAKALGLDNVERPNKKDP